jgi:hypothetical protein
MGSLELLKTICVILSFGLEKVSQKYLKNYIIFIRLRMILVMKTNSIYKKNYIKIFTTSISRCLRRKKTICKRIS